jgi:predicted aconitase
MKGTKEQDVEFLSDLLDRGDKSQIDETLNRYGIIIESPEEARKTIMYMLDGLAKK